MHYVNTYFDYQMLTRIHGQPGHLSLKIIKDKMKANDFSVTSDLGRGANGCLWLMLTQLEYAFVLATDYVRPVHLGLIVIPPATSQHESTRLRENHKEAIRLYREVNAIKQFLNIELGQSLPEFYSCGFRNIYKNTIKTGIPTLLEHLFTT